MTENAPQVWLGCLACYNAGRLMGDWMTPEQAATMTTDELHHRPADRDYLERDRREGYGEHEELVVMDSEYVPLTGEFGQGACQAIADAYDAVGEEQWDAYLAYAGTGLGGMDGSGVSDPSDFEEAFAGHWDSFRSYADEWAEEQIECMAPRDYAGRKVDNGLTEFLTTYFDWEAHADALEQDFTVVPADGGVFIFRNY